MSSPSPVRTPANCSDDIALPESLGISIGDSSSHGDDSDEFDSEVAQPEVLTPSASVNSSMDGNSPSNSHRSHSPELDGQDSDSSSGNGVNGEMNAQGQRTGNGDKRPSQYDNRRNLHVDNLPPMTEVEFRNLFLTFGPIARSRIVTDTITGLPAGYGFVMFENEADAAMALQALHTTYLPNSTKPLRVTVKKPKTAKAWEREREKEAEKQKLLAHVPVNIQTIFVNTNLYVAGLPANWTKREMDEIFSQHGMILESRILLEKHSHISKGVGFVRFQQLECCHQAIQALNGKPPPVPPSLKANGKSNAATANNPNANREDSKQNLTVRFAVDKTAQALAVAQQTVMGTLNQRNSLQHNHSNGNHQHSRSEVGANANNQKYFAVLNSQNIQQTGQRSNSPSLQPHSLQANVHGNYPMSAFSTQQIQSLLAIQQQHLARAAALATVSGSNRNSFTANNSPSNSSANFPYPTSPSASSRLSDPLADLSAYSLENALLLSQLNSPLTSSALSLNQLAAAAGFNALPALSLAPPANSAALNQFYSANSLSTLTPFANPVYVG